MLKINDLHKAAAAGMGLQITGDEKPIKTAIF
jgi:hypothetical protein